MATCDCSIKYHATSLVQDELGPAYKYWKDGASIPQVWEQDLSPFEAFGVNDCCLYGRQYQAGEQAVAHYIMLGCFNVIAIALLVFFFVHRNEQPFKFRDFRVVLIFSVTVIGAMNANAFSWTMAGTIPTKALMLSIVVFTPMILWYYTLKGFQLLFIYKWNEVKTQNRDMKTLAIFNRYKFVLKFKYFLCGYLCLLGLQLLFYGLVFLRPVFSDTKGSSNVIATARCYWWHIPAEYRQPNATSNMYCPCYTYATTSDSSAMSTCTDRIFQGFSECNAGTADAPTKAMCKACVDGLTTDCVDWLYSYVYDGHCGWFDKFPAIDTCVYGMLADKLLSGVQVGEMFFLIIVNALLLAPMLRKKDDFGMIHETLLLLLGYGILLGIWEAGANNLKFYNSWTTLLPTYSLTYLLLFLMGWWCMLLTLGFSVGRYFYTQYHRHRRRVLRKRANNANPNATGKKPIMWSSEGSRVSTRDEHEEEVEFCLGHETLLDDYKRFAVQEFTAENPCFLEEVVKLLHECRLVSVEPTQEKVDEVVTTAMVLNEKYIVANSPLEVNIPFKLKKRIATALDPIMILSQPSAESHVTVEPVHAKNDSQPAVESEYADVIDLEVEEESVGSSSTKAKSHNLKQSIESVGAIQTSKETHEQIPVALRPISSRFSMFGDTRKDLQADGRTLFQRKGTRSKLSEEHQAERLKVEQQVQHDALARTRLSEIYDGFYAAFYEIKMLVVRDSWHRYRETNLFEKFHKYFIQERDVDLQLLKRVAGSIVDSPSPTAVTRSSMTSVRLPKALQGSSSIVKHLDQKESTQSRTFGAEVAERFIRSGSGRVLSIAQPSPTSQAQRPTRSETP